jgi:signal transduction histidine kinase
MFNLNQVGQNRLRIRKEWGDLGQTVRAALAIVQPIVDRAGATLVVQIQDPLPPVLFDADAVYQMVRNLVDNAEKYTRRAENRRIEVDVATAGAAVEVSVSDHGPGVPLASRARIFRPFSGHEKNVETSGLGLGLSVVRTLAIAHGGDVRYEAGPEGGARFVLHFPVESPPDVS